MINRAFTGEGRKQCRRLSALLCLLFLSGSAIAIEARQAKIAWKPIDGATQYELELGTNKTLDPLIETKTAVDTAITLPLSPGTYFFRIRAYHAKNDPGPWSEVQGFTVSPYPPTLKYPAENAVFKKIPSGDGIPFQWDAGPKSSEYQIEVRDEAGVVVSRGVSQHRWEWIPERAGKYQWRVGYSSIFGVEWGGYRYFTIDESVFPETKKRNFLTKTSNCSEIEWANFRLNGLWVFEENSSKLFTPQLAWVPSCSISQNFDVALDLGIAMMKDPKKIFFSVIEYNLLLRFTPPALSPFYLELGGGGQSWVTYGTYLSVQANLGLQRRPNSTRYFIGYAGIPAPTEFIHIPKFGIELHFGE